MTIAHKAYRFFICSKRSRSLRLTDFTITLLHWLGSLLACALLRGANGMLQYPLVKCQFRVSYKY